MRHRLVVAISMPSAARVTVLATVLAIAGLLSARTVRDELGRQITVPPHPHRVVCLAPSLTDTMYALGHGADVAGVTDYTAYPAEAKQKPHVGGVVNPSLETILALHPDLVLALAGLNDYETIRALDRLRIPVFAVKANGMEGAYRSILSVGAALDDLAGARTVVAQLRARQQAVAFSTAGKSRPAVLFVLWPDPLITAGKGAFITELIEAAGAHSVTAEIGERWPRISLEAMVAAAPKYLLLIRGSKVSIEELQKLPGWSSLDAVRKHRVIWVDDRIYYPSPLMLDALEDLSRQIVAAQAH